MHNKDLTPKKEKVKKVKNCTYQADCNEFPIQVTKKKERKWPIEVDNNDKTSQSKIKTYRNHAMQL